MMKKLSMIGCGNVGKTLGRLWARAGVFEIGQILNRSVDSSLSAVDFMGAGQVVGHIENMLPTDVFLIGTADDGIVDSCSALAESGVLQAGNIVFHCSGALPCAILEPASKTGARVASVHPVKSFADPEVSLTSFAGTFCAVEGDEEALSILRPAFESIGGKTFAIDPGHKTIYHAANVIVCNYLTALMEFGIQAYGKAGLDREKSMQVMQPIVRGTVDNIFKLGTVSALTGPIARGDHAVVARHLGAISEWEPLFANVYRELGRLTLELSRKQGTAPANALAALREILR